MFIIPLPTFNILLPVMLGDKLFKVNSLGLKIIEAALDKMSFDSVRLVFM